MWQRVRRRYTNRTKAPLKELNGLKQKSRTRAAPSAWAAMVVPAREAKSSPSQQSPTPHPAPTPWGMPDRFAFWIIGQPAKISHLFGTGVRSQTGQ